MSLPIAGEVEITVESASPCSIHGDLYVDLAARVEGAEAPTMLRIPAQAFPPSDSAPRLPEPGSRFVIQVLLGQVDSIRPVERT